MAGALRLNVLTIQLQSERVFLGQKQRRVDSRQLPSSLLMIGVLGEIKTLIRLELHNLYLVPVRGRI